MEKTQNSLEELFLLWPGNALAREKKNKPEFVLLASYAYSFPCFLFSLYCLLKLIHTKFCSLIITPPCINHLILNLLLRYSKNLFPSLSRFQCYGFTIVPMCQFSFLPFNFFGQVFFFFITLICSLVTLD